MSRQKIVIGCLQAKGDSVPGSVFFLKLVDEPTQCCVRLPNEFCEQSGCLRIACKTLLWLKRWGGHALSTPADAIVGMQAQDLAESGFLDHVGHLVGPIPEWNLEIPEFNLAQTHESNTGFGLTVDILKTGWRLLIL